MKRPSLEMRGEQADNIPGSSQYAESSASLALWDFPTVNYKRKNATVISWFMQNLVNAGMSFDVFRQCF